MIDRRSGEGVRQHSRNVRVTAEAENKLIEIEIAEGMRQHSTNVRVTAKVESAN